LQTRAPYYLELCTINDFGRLVCAFERAPLLTFSFLKGQDHVLATQLDFLNNVPVIYYVKCPNEGQFLAYRHSSGVEEVTVVNTVSNPVYMYSPIISIEKFPRAFSRTPKVSKNVGYVPIKLKDLTSLAKIASYKMIYDEAPLPLFVYKQQTIFIIGTPVVLGESDNVSYFYYITRTDRPLNYFVKYASQKNMVACLSDNLEEHGYIYIKLVNLAAPNPLVKTYE
jgi:hypothetical protein